MAILLLAGTSACKLDQLVTPQPPAKISVSPPALVDSSVVGSTAGINRTLAIQPEGSDHISWKATTAINSPWLTLQNASADAPGTLSLTLKSGALAVGAYTDTVVVTPDGWEDRPVKIPVTFTVRTPPPPAVFLAFTTQPSNTRAASVITPAVQVTARDAAGKTLTTWNGSVTIAIANNPPSGTLSGTLTAAAVNGVTRFANLSIDRVGNAYSLRTSSGNTTGATSASFNVTAKMSSGSKSSVASSLTSINASNGSTTSTITVTARDEDGTSLAGIPVTLTATGTANSLVPPSGTTNAQGFFVSLMSSTRAETKTISATVESIPVKQHASVTVTPAAAAVLVFGVEPANTQALSVITPPVTVLARDQFGNSTASYTGQVTIDIAGSRFVNPRLSGDRNAKAVNGVARFPNLLVTRAGDEFTLVASAPNMTTAVSTTFDVAAF